jgi:tetratricopeptide (TPR) repeat protein
MKALGRCLSVAALCAAVVVFSLSYGNALKAAESGTAASRQATSSTADVSLSSDLSQLSARHFSEAQALRSAGRGFESLAHLRLAYIYADAHESKAQAMLERGQVYYSMRNYHEAAICFRIFLNKFTETARRESVQLALADALFMSGFFREALAAYGEAGTSARALFGKAGTLHRMGRTEEARAVYMAALSLDKDYLRGAQETAYLAAENARAAGRRDDAKALLGAVKDEMLRHRCDLQRGLIAAEEGDHAAAVTYCESAKGSSDRETRRSALLCLGDAAMRAGRKQEGEAYFHELRREYWSGKERDAALLILARLSRSSGRVAEALPMLRELTFRHAPDKDALDEIGQILLEAREQDPSVAAELWKSVGRALLSPSRSSLLLEIAEALKPAGRPFVDLCRWITAHGTDGAKTRCGLSLADYYLSLGDRASAMSYLSNSGVRYLGDDGFRMQARVAYLDGQQDKAVGHLERVRDLSRDDVSLLSLIAGGMEPNSALLALFQRAMMSAQWSPQHHLAYAGLLDRAGRVSDSVEQYRRATAALPSASNGNDDGQWGLYRIATLSRGQESQAAFQKIKKDGQIGRLAELSAKEHRLDELMKEVH